MPAAVVLLSGGLDSATALAIAESRGFDVHCLSFSYGQRHSVELDAAARVAGDRPHKIASIDLRLFGGSALTDDIDVPMHDSAAEIDGETIPPTYVPARNTIFLSFALAYAETLDARDIFIGVNALDYSGYPDCRPEFIEAFETTANLATASGVDESAEGPIRIHAPLINLTKAQIIREGLALGVDYSITHSCYAPEVKGGLVVACGRCDSCLLRVKGFDENGMTDPALAVA